MKKVVWPLILILAILVPMVASCTKSNTSTTSSAPTTSASKVFKIGVIGPLSGPVALWGTMQQQTVQLMADQVNAAGGVDVGGQKYTLQVIAEDDGGDPTKAATAANKLVLQDKVQIIVGAILPNSTSAVQTITEANNVVLFAVSGGMHLGTKYPLTLQASDTMAAVGLNLQVMAQHGIKTIARVGALGINEEWEKWQDGFAKLYGITILNPGIEVVDQGIQDWTPEITKLLALKPDALNSAGMADAPMGLFVKQARQLGFKGPITSASFTGAAVAGVAGIANMDNVEQANWVADGPSAPAGSVKFKSDFQAKYGQDKWDDSAISWTIIVPTIVAGLKQAGTVDASKLIAGMLTAKVEAPPGQVVYGGGDTYGVPRIAYVSGMGAGFWKDGKWQVEVVWTGQQQMDAQAKAFPLKTK